MQGVEVVLTGIGTVCSVVMVALALRDRCGDEPRVS